MKSFLILSVLISPTLYAQYDSKEFALSDEKSAVSLEMKVETEKDMDIPLNTTLPISAFHISGKTFFSNNRDSYVRVTVEDKDGKEYLVYENYPLLSDNRDAEFSKNAAESALLENIIPKRMRLKVQNASVRIDSIYMSPSQKFTRGFVKQAKAFRVAQATYIAERLNRNLKRKGLPWVAGYTSVATLSFEEKKQLFGSVVPCLYGFDYYKGGLYVTPSMIEDMLHSQRGMSGVSQESAGDSTFVKDFDWRNRHGKNWITSVKEQSYNTCWAHATTATLESNFNIYFNQVFSDSINNLSEQELVSCLDNDNRTISQRLYGGSYSMYALDYVQRNGIVRDSCFRFTGVVSCSEKCSNPSEAVSFSAFRNMYVNDIFDETRYIYNDSISKILRKAVIKSPVLVDYFRNAGHSVSCVGFHQIQMGDTIYGNINTGYTFVVDSTTSHFVNMISWIIKNSWGEDWGENGYARVSFYTVPLRLYELLPPFYSLIYSDSDRCVIDEDMDGYYTWGSGARPANLPEWIPDEQDGDDSDPSIGAIDAYGNCNTLTENPAVTWYIDSEVHHSVSDNMTYPNIVIMQNGSLTINSSSMTMKRRATIRIKSGGELVIDGAQIHEADIVVEDGGSLVITHGGIIQLRHDGKYMAQLGARVLINNGRIE